MSKIIIPPSLRTEVLRVLFSAHQGHQCMSSAYHPISNGRAELIVKSTKRLLMENFGSNGELQNEKMVQALLTQRNIPNFGCKLLPAQIKGLIILYQEKCYGIQ